MCDVLSDRYFIVFLSSILAIPKVGSCETFDFSSSVGLGTHEAVARTSERLGSLKTVMFWLEHTVRA